MKGFRGISFLVLVLFAAAPLFAVCNFNVGLTFIERGTRISWSPVQGADQYYLEYSTDGFLTTQRQVLAPNATSVDFLRTLSGFGTRYSFRITALNSKDSNAEVCTGTTALILHGDNAFRAAITRAIVPIVASIPGANGAQFKTSLRLRALTGNTGSGKI